MQQTLIDTCPPSIVPDSVHVVQGVLLRLRGGEEDDAAEGGPEGKQPKVSDTPEWLKDLEADLRLQKNADGTPLLSKNELKRRLKAVCTILLGSVVERVAHTVN